MPASGTSKPSSLCVVTYLTPFGEAESVPAQEPTPCLCTTSTRTSSRISLNLNMISRGPATTSIVSAMPSCPSADAFSRWDPGVTFGTVIGVVPRYTRSMNTLAPGTSLSIRRVAVEGAGAGAGPVGGAGSVLTAGSGLAGGVAGAVVAGTISAGVGRATAGASGRSGAIAAD